MLTGWWKVDASQQGVPSAACTVHTPANPRHRVKCHIYRLLTSHLILQSADNLGACCAYIVRLDLRHSMQHGFEGGTPRQSARDSH